MKSLFLLIAIALISSSLEGFKYSGTKTRTLKSFTALGQTITIQETVGVSNGAAFNQIIIKTGSGSAKFGFSGITSATTKTGSQSANIMTFKFPSMTSISLGLKGSSSLTCSVKESSGKLVITLSGSITASCEIKSGFDSVVSLSAGCKGTIVNISSNFSINSSNYMIQSTRASGGVVSAYISGKLLNTQAFKYESNLWSGWSVSM